MTDTPLHKLFRRWGGQAKSLTSLVERASQDAIDNQTAQASATTAAVVGEAMMSEVFFPPELVGGACPRVKGQERDVVWHAAAEACDTERVHVIWHATEDRVWYVAARAADFTTRATSWCPFASVLPGMKDAAPAPVCYTYYSDEAATMMTVTVDSLQIHRGTSSVVRARAERMARELGGARIIELNPDTIRLLTPRPWYSVSLHEDRLRRLLGLGLVLAGLVTAMLFLLVWLFAMVAIITERRDLEAIQARSEASTLELMGNVERLRASPLREQISRFSELNDQLVHIGGWLRVYEMRGPKIYWRALVPPSITGDLIKDMNAKMIENEERGVVIGVGDSFEKR